MAGKTYSFLDTHATITGPGGFNIPIGSTAGAAEEGITMEYADDVNSMMIGAGGDGVHSLHATKAGKVTIRLLKTSPTNALLEQMYNFQRTSSALHGKNTIVVGSAVSGDKYTCQQAAFKRFPTNLYAKDANVIDWEFDCIQMDTRLGTLN